MQRIIIRVFVIKLSSVDFKPTAFHLFSFSVDSLYPHTDTKFMCIQCMLIDVAITKCYIYTDKLVSSDLFSC